MLDFLKKELSSYIFSLGKFYKSSKPEQIKFTEILNPFFFNLCLYTLTYLYSVSFSRNLNALNYIWQLSFVVQIIFFLFSGLTKPAFYLEKLTFSILAAVHFLRLASYLYIRQRNKTQEQRQIPFRSKLGRECQWYDYFLLFLPELGTATILGTIFLGFLKSNSEVNQPLYWNGILLMVSATVFESIADVQLYQFKQNKLKNEVILDQGLWSLTRHPNYFGEALFWWGVYSCNVSRGVYWTIHAPLIMTSLLAFVFRPQLEALLSNDFGKPYKSYQKRVSAFVPWIPKRIDVLHKVHFTEPIGNYNMEKNPDFFEWKKDQKNVKLYENQKKYNKIKEPYNGPNSAHFYQIQQ